MKNRFSVCLVAALITTACVSNPSVEGKSLANEKLKSDTYNALSRFAKSDLKCSSLDKVVVESAEIVKLGMRNLPDGAIEKWATYGCGGKVLYEVVFSPDLTGAGGYSFGITKQK